MPRRNGCEARMAGVTVVMVPPSGERPRSSRRPGPGPRGPAGRSPGLRARRRPVRADARRRGADVAVTGRGLVAAGIDGHAQEAQPGRGLGPDLRLVLADAAGEDQRVQAVHGRGHGGDLAAQPVGVHIDGQLRAGRSRRRRRPGPRAGRRSRRAAGPARPARRRARGRPRPGPGVRSPCCSSQSRSPGSTLPGRVAMTSPSSGVKPMVVSTLTPPDTAARDEPAPRWQVTTRSCCGSCSRS